MAGFSIPLSALAARSNARLETVVRRVTIDIYRRVILRSPVDTGRFRANWNISYGTPDVTFTGATNKNTTLTAAERSVVASFPVGGISYLANGLPYARELEFGSSTQAPQGMVRLTVREFASAVAQAVGA